MTLMERAHALAMILELADRQEAIWRKLMVACLHRGVASTGATSFLLRRQDATITIDGKPHQLPYWIIDFAGRWAASPGLPDRATVLGQLQKQAKDAFGGNLVTEREALMKLRGALDHLSGGVRVR